MRLSSIFINVAFNDMLFVARGAWFSAVCNGREKRRAGRKLYILSMDASRSSANDEHLCLIAILLAWRDRAGTRERKREGLRTRTRDWKENWTKRKKTGGSELSFLNCFVPWRLPR